MALEAEVPVLPVAMIDTEKIQPPGRSKRSTAQKRANPS
jgi:hypothetical protein